MLTTPATTIVELETLRPAFQPNVTLLRLRSADGHEALGEAFFAAGAPWKPTYGASTADTRSGVGSESPSSTGAIWSWR